MLLYTLIASPGYYMQKGEVAFVLMFAILALLAIAFIGLSICRRGEFLDYLLPKLVAIDGGVT
ncbi:MAG: hypothetical protein GX986_06240 [Firmicutes bacterium]|nr:hypothetical protein [Bacillota bacterium]